VSPPASPTTYRQTTPHGRRSTAVLRVLGIIALAEAILLMTATIIVGLLIVVGVSNALSDSGSNPDPVSTFQQDEGIDPLNPPWTD
jgi:hypothetical protein